MCQRRRCRQGAVGAGTQARARLHWATVVLPSVPCRRLPTQAERARQRAIMALARLDAASTVDQVAYSTGGHSDRSPWWSLAASFREGEHHARVGFAQTEVRIS
jgi:hypothetical protein